MSTEVVGNFATELKVAAYHMEEIADGLRNGELSAIDAADLLSNEVAAAGRALEPDDLRHRSVPAFGEGQEGEPGSTGRRIMTEQSDRPPLCKDFARFPTDAPPYCACLPGSCAKDRGKEPPSYPGGNVAA